MKRSALPSRSLIVLSGPEGLSIRRYRRHKGRHPFHPMPRMSQLSTRNGPYVTARPCDLHPRFANAELSSQVEPLKVGNTSYQVVTAGRRLVEGSVCGRPMRRHVLGGKNACLRRVEIRGSCKPSLWLTTSGKIVGQGAGGRTCCCFGLRLKAQLLIVRPSPRPSSLPP
jgi:hypothetical protein